MGRGFTEMPLSVARHGEELFGLSITGRPKKTSSQIVTITLAQMLPSGGASAGVAVFVRRHAGFASPTVGGSGGEPSCRYSCRV